MCEQHSAEGHRLYASGRYIAAADAYSCAIAWGWAAAPPERSLLYTNRAACWLQIVEQETAAVVASLGDVRKLKDKLPGGGRIGPASKPTKRLLLECAVEDCSAALSLAPGYTKTLWRRALAYEQLGRATEAAHDIELVLLQAPQYKPAVARLRKLGRASGKRAAEIATAAAAAASDAVQGRAASGGGSGTGSSSRVGIQQQQQQQEETHLELPDDVVQLIFVHIGCWRDFVRASCVCKQWSAVSGQSKSP